MEKNLAASKVVAISYGGALMITAANLPISYHYLFFSILSFLLIYLCANINDIRLKVYGIINYLLLGAYVPMMFHDNQFIITAVWEYSWNISDMTQACEIAIIVTGAASGLLAITNRVFNDMRQCYNRRKDVIRFNQ